MSDDLRKRVADVRTRTKLVRSVMGNFSPVVTDFETVFEYIAKLEAVAEAAKELSEWTYFDYPKVTLAVVDALKEAGFGDA